MFEIHEIIDENKIKQCCARFDVPCFTGCRGFILIDEGKEVGFGAIALKGAVVELVGVKVLPSHPRSYWDLLNRAVLNVVRNFEGEIKVFVAGNDDYYLSLGFEKVENGYEVMSSDIDLSGECKKHQG